MARRAPVTLTPLELEIMKVLWEHGAMTVQQVLNKKPGSPLAYTTVQTMLNLLHTKGKVKRALKDRAYVYRAAYSRSQAVGATMKDLIDRMFGGSAEELVMGLVETRQLSRKQLEALRLRLGDRDAE